MGRVPLYLMDTDVEPNDPSDRALSARLYGGDHEMRIAQEIMLGIGGVRALRALGIDADGLAHERGPLRLPRPGALPRAGRRGWMSPSRSRARSPPPTPSSPPIRPSPRATTPSTSTWWTRYFARLLAAAAARPRGVPRARPREGRAGATGFSMTVLALRLSSQHNGVSKLHGEVSRAMWQFLWPELEVDEVAHRLDHQRRAYRHLARARARRRSITRYLGADWYAHLDDPAPGSRVDEIPDGELWEAHRQLKSELFAYARARARAPAHAHRRGQGRARRGEHRCSTPSALTLGFARRFATYKRATLLFRDPERLARLLNNAERPVQIVFAGKAHPADKPGQEFIRRSTSTRASRSSRARSSSSKTTTWTWRGTWSAAAMSG